MIGLGSTLSRLGTGNTHATSASVLTPVNVCILVYHIYIYIKITNTYIYIYTHIDRYTYAHIILDGNRSLHKFENQIVCCLIGSARCLTLCICLPASLVHCPAHISGRTAKRQMILVHAPATRVIIYICIYIYTYI